MMRTQCFYKKLVRTRLLAVLQSQVLALFDLGNLGEQSRSLKWCLSDERFDSVVLAA